MKNSKDILGSVVKTTQMGQIGIRSVMGASMRPALRQALESQLREYDQIEEEALDILTRRNWQVAQLGSMAKACSKAVSKAKLSRGNTDSKIAAMMIQGNTRGMIKGLRNMHQFPQQDTAVSGLSQRLLDIETDNIRQMKAFL